MYVVCPYCIRKLTSQVTQCDKKTTATHRIIRNYMLHQLHRQARDAIFFPRGHNCVGNKRGHVL